MTIDSVYGQTISPFSPDEIQQSTGYTCAVKSQQLILNMFGVDVTEQQLMDEAFEHGLLTQDGTPMGDIGKLLELHGVDTQTFESGNIATLMNELAQGHQVIVGVDSGELWEPLEEFYEDSAMGQVPDHALLVTGVDVRDPQNVQVIVTDPGSGCCRSYPYEQFVDAWSDSNFFMVSTTEAPDIPEVENLNEDFTESLLSSADFMISQVADYVVPGGALAEVCEVVGGIVEDWMSGDNDDGAMLASQFTPADTGCVDFEPDSDLDSDLDRDLSSELDADFEAGSFLS